MPTESRRDFLNLGLASMAGGALAQAPLRAQSADLHVDNVILVVSDSLRWDALSCYRKDWIRTPHLDRFAGQAVAFDNAYLASFPTVPLRNDLLTGRYTFTYKGWSPIGAREVTLQDTLHRSGILTSLVVDTPHPFAPGYNYQRGFDAWRLIRGQETDNFRTAPREVKLPCNPSKLRLAYETVTQYLRNVSHRRREEDYFVAQTMTAAADWLEENADGRRFFLYVDTFDPHEPWDPPKYYVEPYDPGYDGEEVIYPRYDLWRDFLSEKELNHCRALYAGEVTMVDRWVGMLLDRVATLGLMKNTAVIVTSDHGFYFGEHGYIGKELLRGQYYQNVPLYPEVLKIPLLVYFPGCRGGTRMDALVQSVDLMPTVLDLLKVEKPKSVTSDSLAPLLAGRVSRVKDLIVGAPSLLESRQEPPEPDSRASITDGEWLLIEGARARGGTGQTRSAAVDSRVREVRQMQGDIRPELYHLTEDPACAKNLFAGRGSEVQRLHAGFLEFLKKNQYPEDRLAYFSI